MATINVDVDIDDILWDLSDYEKRDLCEQLIEDGYAPDSDLFDDVELGDVLQTETYTECELVSLIEDLWNNRRFIDHKLVEELRVQLRERNVL